MSEKVPFQEGLFIEDAKGARLLANKCESGGQIFFPKKNMCLDCAKVGLAHTMGGMAIDLEIATCAIHILKI